MEGLYYASYSSSMHRIVPTANAWNQYGLMWHRPFTTPTFVWVELIAQGLPAQLHSLEYQAFRQYCCELLRL